MSGPCVFQQPGGAAPQSRVLFMGLLHDPASKLCEPEVPPGATGLGSIEARNQQTLLLETAECDEYRRLRHRPLQPLFKIEDKRHAVGLVSVAKHGEQNLQFEVLKGH